MLPVITTERLRLRPLSRADLDDFHEYCKVKGVGESAGWIHHSSLAESRFVLNRLLSATTQSIFALELRASGKMIGTIGIKDILGVGSVFRPLFGFEIGYVLSKDYWGQGLMHEAVGKVLRYCFAVLNAKALYLDIFEGNDRSMGVAKKLGFAFIGKDVEPTKFASGTFLVNHFMLSRDEWSRNKQGVV